MALIQYDRCPYKKGNLGHRDRHTQRKGDVDVMRHRENATWRSE